LAPHGEKVCSIFLFPLPRRAPWLVDWHRGRPLSAELSCQVRAHLLVGPPVFFPSSIQLQGPWESRGGKIPARAELRTLSTRRWKFESSSDDSRSNCCAIPRDFRVSSGAGGKQGKPWSKAGQKYTRTVRGPLVNRLKVSSIFT